MRSILLPDSLNRASLLNYYGFSDVLLLVPSIPEGRVLEHDTVFLGPHRDGKKKVEKKVGENGLVAVNTDVLGEEFKGLAQCNRAYPSGTRFLNVKV